MRTNVTVRTAPSTPSHFRGQSCTHRHAPTDPDRPARARTRDRTRLGPPLLPPADPTHHVASLPAVFSPLLLFSLSLADYLVTFSIASSSRSRSCTRFRRLLPIYARFYLRERVRRTRPSPPPPPSACLLCPSRPVPLQHSPLYLSLTVIQARWLPLALETPP